MKYSLFKILLAVYTERKHRKVFDNLYVQNYKIKISDKPLLIFYKFLCRKNPKFRRDLKHWKIVLDKAYKLKRLGLFNYCVYFKLNKINTERYASDHT